MKVLIVVCIVAVVGIAIVVSGSREDASGSGNTTEVSGERSAERTTTTTGYTKSEINVGWGQAVDIDGIKIAVAAPEPHEASLPTQEGDVWSLEVTVSNTTDGEQYWSDNWFELADGEGNRYGDAIWLVSGGVGELTLLPGETVSGTIGFDILSGAPPTFLRYEPVGSVALVIWAD